MKNLRNNLRLKFAVMAVLLPTFVTLPMATWANPQGGNVISGDFEILDPDGGFQGIEQFSDRGIIEWESFSISGGETTEFLQGSSMAVLNRVTGGSSSQINGTLKAGGTVWLINQNGVVVGPGGSVDVFGFLASTLDVSNAAFMGGGDVTLSGGSVAPTQNFGKINAAGGDVFLVGRAVDNFGTIGAVDGMVGLAGGNEVLLKASGAERVFISAGDGTYVNNAGEINSAMAELKAHGNIGALAVNNTGVIRATTSSTQGGRVVLASNSGTVANTGVIETRNLDGSGGEIEIRTGQGEIQIGGILSATGVAGRGGNVRILGDTVNVAAGTSIDASGTEGGSVEITSQTQSMLQIGAGTSIQAEGTFGDGGQVNVSAGDIVIYGDSTLGADGEVDGGLVSVTGTGVVLLDGGLSAIGRIADGGSVSVSGTDVLMGETGSINASGEEDGGTVNMFAEEQLVINGSVAARGTSGKGGTIGLTGEDILISQDGSVDASGASGGTIGISADGDVIIAGQVAARGSDGAGGVIGISGEDIVVAGGGVVDASGSAGGGFISVNASDSAVIMGSVLATGGSGAGGTINVNATDVVVGATGNIDAGGATGGLINLSGVDSVQVSGRVGAIGSNGSGGTINVTGAEVDILPGANIDAGGLTAGGNINIGGGFQGNDPNLQNSQSTRIAPGALINASSAAGSGGTIAIWSDGATNFQGTANTDGAIDGGLVEVSGLESLAFDGNVSANGVTGNVGTLLLDPVNVLIGATGITTAALDTALAAANVVIHTSPVGILDPGEPGNITTDTGLDFRYTSPNSLSLFAHNDIGIAGIIKNHGAGNINLVAGWDGTGGDLFTNPNGNAQTHQHGAGVGAMGADVNPAGPIAAEDILAGNFGQWGTNDLGNVVINSSQTVRASVGTAHGETNVFAGSVLVQTGNGGGEFGQIGYWNEAANIDPDNIVGNTAHGNANAGDINIYAKRNIVAQASTGGDRHVQIGHGGVRDDGGLAGETELLQGDMRGNITLRAGGATVIQGGGNNRSFAHVGHGGFADSWAGRQSHGNLSGNIDIESGILIMTVDNNARRSHVQIGHGGDRFRGEHYGNINVTTTIGDILGSSSALNNSNNDGQRSYMMIGHGGYESDHVSARPFDIDGGSAAGDEIPTVDIVNADAETISNGSEITAMVDASATTGEFRKVGHAGNITVNSAGAITMTAGSGNDQWAHIGHGGRAVAGEFGSWDIDNADGDGDWATGTDGDVTVIANGGGIIFDRNIRGFQDGSGTENLNRGSVAYSKIGHGGYLSTGGGHGDIHVEAKAGGVEFYGGRNESFAQIGHGGRSDSWGANNAAAAHDNNFAQGTHTGDVTVLATDDIIFRSGFGQGGRQFSQIGHGGFENMAGLDSSGAMEGFNGDILVRTTGGDIDFYAGQKSTDPLFSGQIRQERNGFNSHTMIGHGGRRAKGDHWGNVTVEASGDISIEATGGYDAIGFVDDPLFDSDGDMDPDDGDDNNDSDTGLPSFDTGNNNSLTGEQNFAMIGHGGQDSESRATSGNIRDRTGANGVGFGVLGESNILVDAGGDLRVAAAQKVNQGPQEGFFGGTFPTGLNPNVPNDLLPDPVEHARDSYAQIGHGGSSTELLTDGLGHRGSITVISGGSIDLIGGDFEKGLVSTETGALFADPAFNLNGRVTDSRDVFNNYAQIGHGGASSRGDHISEISVTAVTDIMLSGGSAQDSFAMIGNGGTETDNPNGGSAENVGHSGNITVTTDGNISLLAGGQRVGQDPFGQDDPDLTGNNPNPGDDSRAMYALIGNGGAFSNGSHSGNVTVNAGGDVTLKGGLGERDNFAQIGNAAHGQRSDLYGDTKVTVGGDLLLERGPDLQPGGNAILNNYAKIGLGYHRISNQRTDDRDIRDGNIEVDVIGTITNTGGLIGHVDTVQGQRTELFGGDMVSGDTFIRANAIVADEFAAFASGSNGVLDELRFYLPDRAANGLQGSDTATGTILNGARYVGTPNDGDPDRADEVFGEFENLGDGDMPAHGLGGFYGLFYGPVPGPAVPPVGGGGGGGEQIPVEETPRQEIIEVVLNLPEAEVDVFIPDVFIPLEERFLDLILIQNGIIEFLDDSDETLEGEFTTVDEDDPNAPKKRIRYTAGFSNEYPGNSTGSVYNSRNVGGGGFAPFDDRLGEENGMVEDTSVPPEVFVPEETVPEPTGVVENTFGGVNTEEEEEENEELPPTGEMEETPLMEEETPAAETENPFDPFAQ